MKEVKTNSGISIPIVGSGTNTFGKVDNDYQGELTGSTKEMEWAIESGYRHFDAAQNYRNEEIIGRALYNSDLEREAFFITTKLKKAPDYLGKGWMEQQIEESLYNFRTEYIDLFLIHAPFDKREDNIEAWKALEGYLEEGIFKAIGVSNFEREDLDLILDKATVPPAVNQIESHVGKWNEDLIDYHKNNDILTTAWSPLAGMEGEAQATLEEIGRSYDKSAAQVVLRYQVERDVIVIPKSHNKEHQAESLDIFDFELSETDKEKIRAL